MIPWTWHPNQPENPTAYRIYDEDERVRAYIDEDGGAAVFPVLDDGGSPSIQIKHATPEQAHTLAERILQRDLPDPPTMR